MTKKKTHEQFVNELREVNPTIEVMSLYQTALTKIQIKCSLCGNMWESKPNSLLIGSGCPNCGKKKIGDALRKSNSDFISELAVVNPNVETLEEYAGNRVKILLHCKICDHEWKTNPHDLLSGHGCPMCGYEKQKNAQRRTHKDFLESLEKVNTEIHVIDEYVNNHTKIRFQCKNCGRIWKTVPNSVLLGHGCPDCAHSSTSFLEQVILQSFKTALGEDDVISRDRSLIGMELDIVIPSLKIAYEPGSWAWHYNKKTKDTQKRIRCKELGYQLITIYTDYKSNDIPYDSNCYTLKYNLGVSNWDETKSFVTELLCEHNIKLNEDQWEKVREVALEKSRKITNEECIEKLYAVNPKIKVIGTYINNSIKVKLQCLICGKIWESMPSSVLSGHGCPYCGKRRSADSMRKTQEQFVSELKMISPNIIVLGDYVNTKTKILCECQVCGNRWDILPQNLLKGQGCPLCARTRAANKMKKTHNQFVDELKNKNSLLKVCSPYVDSYSKIKIECMNCGYFWHVNPTRILKKSSCPKCSKNKN